MKRDFLIRTSIPQARIFCQWCARERVGNRVLPPLTREAGPPLPGCTPHNRERIPPVIYRALARRIRNVFPASNEPRWQLGQRTTGRAHGEQPWARARKTTASNRGRWDRASERGCLPRPNRAVPGTGRVGSHAAAGERDPPSEHSPGVSPPALFPPPSSSPDQRDRPERRGLWRVPVTPGPARGCLPRK